VRMQNGHLQAFESLFPLGRKWDKEDRSPLGALPPALTCQDLSRKRSSSSLNKSNWKRIKLLGYSPKACDSESWPVINDNPGAISFCLNLEFHAKIAK
jgi:hypothetical protein